MTIEHFGGYTILGVELIICCAAVACILRMKGDRAARIFLLNAILIWGLITILRLAIRLSSN